MSIPIEAYTIAGIVRGRMPGSGSLRDRLESQGIVELREVAFAPVDGPDDARAQDDLHVDPDEILVVLDTDGGSHAHAAWHEVRVALGPWVVDGNLATMPGFDPGRALTRPSGSFIALRDATVARADGLVVADHHDVLVHRYAVERVEADLELGFHFPGASVRVAAGIGSGRQATEGTQAPS